MNNDILEPPPLPVETSLVTRLTNVFIAPGEAFEEIKSRPVRHANWLVAALIFVLLSWCSAGVISTQESIRHQLTEIQDQATQKRAQKDIDAGRKTQAQIDQAKAASEQITRVIFIIAAIIGPPLAAAIAPFFNGFMLWAISHLILRKPLAYLKAVEASGMTLVVAGLGALVKGLLCAALGTMFTSPGLVLLVKNYNPTNLLHTVLLSFDAFLIWSTVLSGIALAKLTGASLVKAVVWVLIVSFTITGGFLTLSWAAGRMAERLTGG